MWLHPLSFYFVPVTQIVVVGLSFLSTIPGQDQKAIRPLPEDCNYCTLINCMDSTTLVSILLLLPVALVVISMQLGILRLIGRATWTSVSLAVGILTPMQLLILQSFVLDTEPVLLNAFEPLLTASGNLPEELEGPIIILVLLNLQVLYFLAGSLSLYGLLTSKGTYRPGLTAALTTAVFPTILWSAALLLWTYYVCFIK